MSGREFNDEIGKPNADEEEAEISETIPEAGEEAKKTEADEILGINDEEMEAYSLIITLGNITKGDLALLLREEGLDVKIQIEYWDDFTEGELVDFSLLAYATTEEDRQIHGYDKAVTDPEVISKVHERLRSGAIGSTVPELWKVGLVDGEPAGFIGAFIINRQRDIRVGVLGPVGVFPSHRRKGVATRLIQLQLRDLQDMGCHYSYVGTPYNNSNAIALYQKVGFEIVDRQILLRKNFE